MPESPLISSILEHCTLPVSLTGLQRTSSAFTSHGDMQHQNSAPLTSRPSWIHSRSASCAGHSGSASSPGIHIERVSCNTARGLRTVDIGSFTLAGNRYTEHCNQDYIVTQEMYAAGEVPKHGQQTYIAAICDGHGILGSKSAAYAAKALARHVYCSNLRNKQLAKVDSNEIIMELKAAFQKAHQAANSVYDAPPRTVDYPAAPGTTRLTQFTLVNVGDTKVYRTDSGIEKMLEFGSTCTAAIIQGRCVCIANVGDSQAVVGRLSDIKQREDGIIATAYEGRIVTVRHHGMLASEYSRITTMHSDTTRVLEDGYIQVITGPWAGYELAVTRALGHKNIEQYGVSAYPSVSMLELDSQDCCLVLASDGVWDVMNAQQVVQYVMLQVADGKGAAEAAKALVAHATQLGLNSDLGEQDNTSAIVVLFLKA